METALAVKDNDFEKIIKKLTKKQEQVEQENETSGLNLRRKRQLAVAIASVYYFLRVTLNLSEKWDLTLEEFETVEAELKRKAEKEKEKIRRKFFKFFGLRSAWGYYLEFGHFPIKRAPFRNKPKWYYSHPWAGKNFDPECSANSFSLPPNYMELLKQIFEKRYPQVGKPQQKTDFVGEQGGRIGNNAGS